MPRYFFHIHGSRDYVDMDGVDLANLQAAKMESLRIIRELMADSTLDDLWSAGECVMTVTDDAAQNLFSIRLSTAQQTGGGCD